MLVIRIIFFIVISFSSGLFADSYDVNDFLYRSLIGDNVKGHMLGVEYDDQPEMLLEDLLLVKKAMVKYKYSPVNVRVDEYPLPLNYDDLEVSFEVIGRYNSKDFSINLHEFNEVRHLKYNYSKKRFEGITSSEPQFVSCSTFIDHVYNVSNYLKEKNVISYEDDHPNKIYYLGLSKIISILDKDSANYFCKDGFSLIIERTPPAKAEKTK
jgi:hypothetical protein